MDSERKMNWFREQVHKNSAERWLARQEIIGFSEELQKAMGLDYSEIEYAADNGITWLVGEYTIFAERRPWYDWKALLQVVPATVSPNVGYSNVPGTLPEDWHFRKEGTATEILPPSEIRADIIRKAKERRQQTEGQEYERHKIAGGERKDRELWMEIRRKYYQAGYMDRETIEKIWREGTQVRKEDIIKWTLIFLGLALIYAGFFIYDWLYGSVR